MRPNDPLLTVQNLALERGWKQLFSGFDLTVGRAELHHITGPNGCGKTTLMRALAGLVSPSRGTIETSPDVGQRGMRYLGHNNGLKGSLTVRENLLWYANAVTDTNPRSSVGSAMAQLELNAVADQSCQTLSQGQKRRAAIARIVLGTPQLWLLDEPGVGLDAAGNRRLKELFQTHLECGGSILLVSHDRLTGIRPTQVLNLPDYAAA